ncbi:hypothetical protein [Corynebacterium sp. H113]|uniref:hypothetical protein n=1 Tax=Corynebacterium sp. H113 TaxID=3133419 RepID=UPI00309A72B8
MDNEDDFTEYTPTAADFHPVKAAWFGHLFENAPIGLEPQLYLGVNIECADLDVTNLDTIELSGTAEFQGVNYGLDEPGRLSGFLDATDFVQVGSSALFVPRG